MKVSKYIATFLSDRGIRHVFSVPGGNSMFLNDAIGHYPGITTIPMLHEQAAGIAAEAYATAGGGIGVCCTTSGPGATNAITGCLAAWLDSTPVLFLSGQCKRADSAGASLLRQLGNQEAPIIKMVSPITKYAVTINDPTHIRHALEKAFYTMRADRPGPVWIEIPVDVQGMEIDPPKCPGFGDGTKLKVYRDELTAAVTDIFQRIQKAERPVILAGNGVRRAGAVAEFRKLIDLLGVPVLVTRQGCDLLPYNHPLHAGTPGTFASHGANWTMQQADLLLIIGARMDRATIAYAPTKLAPNAVKIMVDIDQAEIEKLPRVGAVVCDAADFIERLTTRVVGSPKIPHVVWIAKTQEWKRDYPLVEPKHCTTTGLSMYAFSKALSDALAADDAILPGSSGFASEVFLTCLQVKDGQRVFHNKGTGAMGFCQPAAIGAALATGRRVVCVDGDGGFQMNIQELETIRRLNLNVKIFVMTNHGYASIRSSQKKHFGRLTGADESSGLTLPNLQDICRAFGICVLRYERCNEAGNLIKWTLNREGPVVCEVPVFPDEVREPCVQTFLEEDGTIRSGSLEEMWPPLI